MIVVLTAIGAMLIWRIAWRAPSPPRPRGLRGLPLCSRQLSPSILYGVSRRTGSAGCRSRRPAGPCSSLEGTPGLLPVTLTGIALAALPWLHTRSRCCRRARSRHHPGGGRDGRAGEDARESSVLIALLAVPLVSALLWSISSKSTTERSIRARRIRRRRRSSAGSCPPFLGCFRWSFWGGRLCACRCARRCWLGNGAEDIPTLAIELGVIALVDLAAITTIRMWQGRPTGAACAIPDGAVADVRGPARDGVDAGITGSRALYAGRAGCGAIVTAGGAVADRAGSLLNDRTTNRCGLNGCRRSQTCRECGRPSTGRRRDFRGMCGRRNRSRPLARDQAPGAPAARCGVALGNSDSRDSRACRLAFTAPKRSIQLPVSSP